MNLRSPSGRFYAVFLLSALVMLPTASLSAQIDPTLYFLRKITASEGLKSPVFGPPGHSARGGIDETGARVLLRFQDPLNTEQITLLEKNGIQFERDSTRKNNPILHNHTLYRAYIPWSSLDFLAQYPGLIRAEAGWSPGFLRPLEQTSAQVGATAANILPTLGVDGQGMLIGNIDSGVDVVHPAFFHADGGFFSWIDVNQNDQFDPGIDAVDLNHNGIADRNEILRVLDGSFIKDFTDQVQNYDGILQTRTDWLYADLNQDRERNKGRDAGFDEQTPAYGEPLFVVDDANENGQLDPGEKLVRLKTSKIRTLVESTATYERGRNLIDAATAQSLENAFHGTGVSGILIGGQPGFHDRVGLAPAADLIVYVANDENWETTIAAAFIEHAIAHKVDVLLHEWTECFVHAIDGSSNLEAAMDRARDAGVLQVNPAGNLNLSQKSILRPATAGHTADFSINLHQDFYRDPQTQPYSAIYGSFHWQGNTIPTFSMQSPEGPPLPIQLNATNSSIPNVHMQWNYEQTARGTHIITFYIWTHITGTSLPKGRWTIKLADITEDSTYFARVSDYYSGWDTGIAWEQSTNNQMTLCFPATADSAIGVAAYAGRHDRLDSDNSHIGELRNFSSRGPRIDGRPQIALSAPDDPYAPLAATPQMLAAGWGTSWYATFGGTSGAGPHVAASAALLRQQHPDWSPEQIENRLYETADRNQLIPTPTTFPDTGWGWGKLNIYRALYDRPIPQNQAPVAILTTEIRDDLLFIDASHSTDPDGDPLEFRFDLDYDGIWDIDWTETPNTTRPHTFFDTETPNHTHYLRLEVRDPNGARSSALARISFDQESTETPDAGNPDDTPDVGSMSPIPEKPETPSNMQQSQSDACSCNTVAPRTSFPVYSFLAAALLLISRRVLHGDLRKKYP